MQKHLRDILAEEDNRRQFIKKAIETGIFTSVAASGAMTPFAHAIGGQVPKQLASDQSIYQLKGRVSVDAKKADKSTVIKADSFIKTGSNSLIIFRVGTDAHILRENSEMQLVGENFVEEGLRLLTGKLLSVFGQRSPSKSHTMRTTTATIGIRGTGVYAESEPDHSYVCTCYGTVDIASDRDSASKERVVATHHDAPRYILADGNESKLVIPAPMKNHDDEELMLTEAIVGRTTPFSNIRSYSRPRKSY